MILKYSFIIVYYTIVTEMHVGCQLVHNSYQDFLCYSAVFWISYTA